jgi:hypothetical protein
MDFIYGKSRKARRYFSLAHSEWKYLTHRKLNLKRTKVSLVHENLS